MVQTTVLDNGVTVVTERITYVHSVSIGIWVKTGSRHEHKQQQGISHFIEHMLFKGTPRHNAFDIARIIDSVGGFLNAFTGKEYTCFYVKVLSQHLPLALDILKDLFLNSLFAEEDIEKEREVILQEINMIRDTPDEYIQDLFNESYFSGHPLGYPILGEEKTVRDLDKNSLLTFFAAEYLQPRRIIIAAAGNFEHDQLLDAVGDSFNRLTLNQDAAATDSFVPGSRATFNYRKLEQAHICIGTNGLSQLDSRRYAFYALNTLFGGSMSSRLFQEIRERQGLAYSVYSFVSSFLDIGLFGIYLGVRKDMVKKALPIVLGEIQKLKEQNISELELSSAKEQLKGSMLLSAESSDNRMSRLAKCEIYYNKFIPLEEVVAEIDAITSEDVQALATAIFNNDCLNYTFLGPVKEKQIPAQMLFKR